MDDPTIYKELQKLTSHVTSVKETIIDEVHQVDLIANEALQKSNSVQVELSEHKDETTTQFQTLDARTMWILGSVILGVLFAIYSAVAP